jgi:hypothetical protein
MTALTLRLRGRVHKTVLCAHILAAAGWFGVAATVAFIALAAAVTPDAAFARALHRTMETVPWFSVPLGLVAVATGVLLGLGTLWGLVKHWWVIAKIVIAVVVIITDPLLIARAAHHAVVTGNAPSWLYGPTIAHVVVLATATVLSVFKPRARTPWARLSS